MARKRSRGPRRARFGIGRGADPIGWIGFGLAILIVSRHPAGSTCTCWYDPEEPDLAVLVK